VILHPRIELGSIYGSQITENHARSNGAAGTVVILAGDDRGTDKGT
jgi:hypothetical protein